MEIVKIDSEAYWDILETRPNFTGCVEDADGDRCWYKHGKRHRDGDLPAEICTSCGVSIWVKYVSLHLENATAVVFSYGLVIYFLND
jgi:hypothetical protein